MKKFLSILLILLLLLCLTSCKKPEPEPVHENTFEDYLSIYARKVPDKADTSTLDLALYAPAQGYSDFYGLYGYANILGEWVIYPTVSFTGVFSEGLATYTNTYNMYHYVMKNNETVLTMMDGDSIVEDTHAQEGVLVLNTDASTYQTYVYLDSSTLGYAFDHYKIPFVAGRWYATDYRFAVASVFNNGKAVVMRLKNSDIQDELGPERAYVIDKTGKVLAKLPEGWDADVYGVDDNDAVIVYNQDHLYGLCSASDGSVLIEPSYKFLRHCQGSLYLVCTDDGLWGYVDKNGNVAIEAKYYKATCFSGGVAAVYNGEKWGFIDETGETVLDFIFDNVGHLEQGNIDESLDEGPCKEGLVAIEKDGYWAIIDLDMNVIISIASKDLEGVDGCPYSSMMNGAIIFKKNVEGTVLCGAFNYKGELIFDAKFLSLGAFN